MTRFATVLAACLVTALAHAAQPDGPYVMRGAGGALEAWSVEVTGDEAHKRVDALKPGATVTIPAVGAYPAFQVKLRAPAADAPDVVSVPAKSPIFVVADTHGEFEILAQMLTSQKIVDAKLRWAFGRGHLVVLGDVFDRGPNHLEILWLLYELEAQAAKAGGGVHFVLGNHEAMVLRGDLRYLNAKYPATARALDKSSYAALFAADTLLGQWLRSRPVMLLVNDQLCLHAGVSRALVDSQLTLAEINATARSVLRKETEAGAIAGLVMGSLGPLWYRGYFPEQGGFLTATREDVDLALKHFGARRILVGHTIVPTITPLYDGRVVAVQVYPKHAEGGRTHFESLVLKKGQLWQALPDGALRRLEKPR